MKIYPGSSPEFRILVRATGDQVFQVRYVHAAYGYTGQWMDIPVVCEQSAPNTKSAAIQAAAY